MKSATTREVLSTISAGLILALVIVAALGTRYVIADNQWPIEWIEVHGEFQRVSAEQVRSAAAPMLHTGFFMVDLPAVKSTVEDLPWVRMAEVRKVWPDQVEIVVMEHEPLARWGDHRLVSAMGEVFEIAGGISIEGLPRLVGEDAEAPQMIEFFARLQDLLAGTGLDVLELRRSHRGGWLASLSSGLTVNMGRDEPLERMTRLVSALDELRADPVRRPEAIDLRYTNGFAVRWRDLPESNDGLAQVAEGGLPGGGH